MIFVRNIKVSPCKLVHISNTNTRVPLVKFVHFEIPTQWSFLVKMTILLILYKRGPLCWHFKNVGPRCALQNKRAHRARRSRASRFIASLNQARDLSKSDARAPRASLAIISDYKKITNRN